MRLGPVLFIVLALTATAVLPGMALAQGGHGEHGGHDEGPTNPLKKSVTLYPDAAGALVPEPPGAGLVPAGPADPLGNSEPVAWSITATKNSVLDQSVFIEWYVVVDQVSLVAGGPEGAAFSFQLTHNGEPVDGIASTARLDTTLLMPGDAERLRLFLPQPDLVLAPGDTVGVQVRYHGLNLEGQPAVSYQVGGADPTTSSRMAFRVSLASMDEVMVPPEVGSWPIAPLDGFDFEAAKRADPEAQVFTLRAFQFGFDGAPVVVQNGSKVVLHLYVDETLGTGEGHGGHAHEEGGEGGHAMAWDESMVTAVHGFSLAAFKPGLDTVLFENAVVTLTFTADKPGNYTFLCTVFCGTGHGQMLDRLTIEGPALTPEELEQTRAQGEGNASTPGFEALGLLAAVGVAALLVARRR